MNEKILIIDFGAQYTQLIARTVRENNVYCEIIPYNKEIEFSPGLKGIILSGSPFSVNDSVAPSVDIISISKKLPVLAYAMALSSWPKFWEGSLKKVIKENMVVQN